MMHYRKFLSNANLFSMSVTKKIPEEILADWESLRKKAQQLRTENKMSLPDLCKLIGCNFEPFYYKLLNEVKSPSKQTGSLGRLFHEALSKFFSVEKPSIPLSEDQNPTNIWDTNEEKFISLPFFHSRTFQSPQGKKLELTFEVNDLENIKEIQEKLRSLSLSLKDVQIEPRFLFPPENDCGISINSTDLVTGGTPICATTQPEYSTLGVILTDCNFGITVGHAVDPQSIRTGDHTTAVEYNSHVQVQIHNQIVDFGFVTKVAREICIFIPIASVPTITNFVTEIGPVWLPSTKLCAQLKDLILIKKMTIVVKKYGARTRLTYGKIQTEYFPPNGDLEIAPLRMTDVISDHGDSGACWVIENYLGFRNCIIGFHHSSRLMQSMNQTIRIAQAIPVWEVVEMINNLVENQIV